MSPIVSGVVGMTLVLLSWSSLPLLLDSASIALLPSPRDVSIELYALGSTGQLYGEFFATCNRWMLGFSIGAITGIFFGGLSGVIQPLRNILDFPVEFFRAIPVTALIPLFFLFFGVGDTSKVAMAAFAAFLLLFVQTSSGVHQVSPMRREMFRLYGATFWQTLRFLVAREILPSIFLGLKLASSLSLVVVVVSEMFLGASNGLGQRIYESYMTNSVSTLFAFVFLTGLLGYVTATTFTTLEHRAKRWGTTC